MAKKRPSPKETRLSAEVEDVLDTMDVPKVILVGDWGCPLGHFNTRTAELCARCVREGNKMTSVHPLVVARDKDSIETLRDYLHARKLEENLSRPSSQEAVAEAVAAAERSVEGH